MIRAVLLLLALGLSSCGEPEHPVTRCIAYGHEIEECIDLAWALRCAREIKTASGDLPGTDRGLAEPE